MFAAFVAGCVGTDLVDPADSGGDTDTDADTDTDTDTDADTDTPPEPVALGSGTDGALTIEAWADAAPRVGLNHLSFRVLEGGAPVDGLTVTHAPWMGMDDMGHACPYTVPVATGDGWYTSEVVFLMGGAWTDTVTGTDGATSLSHTFDLEVAETNLGAVVTAGDASWFVSFTLPEGPAVGANPFALTVHTMVDAETFPEVAGIQAVVEPTMPSMGHGSEGNVDPVYVANGVYEGTVVFSMAGPWEVAFTLTDTDGAEVAVTFALEV